jgi:hypothetical protein
MPRRDTCDVRRATCNVRTSDECALRSTARNVARVFTCDVRRATCNVRISDECALRSTARNVARGTRTSHVARCTCCTLHVARGTWHVLLDRYAAAQGGVVRVVVVVEAARPRGGEAVRVAGLTLRQRADGVHLRAVGVCRVRVGRHVVAS